MSPKTESFSRFLLCKRMLSLRSARFAPRLTCSHPKHPITALMPSRFYHYLLIILASLISTQALHAITPTPTPTPTPATRTVKLAWKASPSAEVVGYKIFWGTGSYNYQNVRDVENVLTTSLTLSQNKEYYVAVIAYSMTTSSWFSNEVIVPAASVTW
jgi:hypothetical protein